jgi:molecular chaperone HscB
MNVGILNKNLTFRIFKLSKVNKNAWRSYHSFSKLPQVSVSGSEFDLYAESKIRQRINLTNVTKTYGYAGNNLFKHPRTNFSTGGFSETSNHVNSYYEAFKCQKCSKQCTDRLKFFWGECHQLKDPEVLNSVNYFELFSIEEIYDINKKELEQTFYKLQKLFHPDRFTSENDDKLVESSTTYSSFINNGYYLLKNDLERAKYLLKMHGYSVLEEDEKLTDMDLLMQIMETREEIEFANNQEELDIHKKVAQDTKTKLIKKISWLFSNEEYEAVKMRLIKLVYHDRILEAIDEKEREFM